MNKPLISLICAMDRNRLIGNNNGLPWHLPADLKLFKKNTLGKPVVMGRKTYESIGKALPGRQNVVITSMQDWSAPNCDIARSVEHALELTAGAAEVMLIGGASLYRQTIDIADIIYLTIINHSFSGDTWFPEIDLKCWRVVTKELFDSDEENQYSFSFVKYIRETI
ncbi:MAG: dihydrofolate reductase [Gammaproteobacteria bacterium]|nr:dihydrofolate reductase [Gammaproteobacteria bacterium]